MNFKIRILLFIVFQLLTVGLLVTAQQCDFKVSTSEEFTSTLSLVCNDPSIYQTTICLQGGASFTSPIQLYNCGQKVYTLTAPPDAPATIRGYISWTARMLTWENIIYYPSGSSNPCYINSPSFTLTNCSLVTPTSSTPYIWQIFGTSTVVISNFRASGLNIRNLFLSDSPLTLEIDGMNVSDSTVSGNLFTASTLKLTNSVFSRIIGSYPAPFSISPPSTSSVVQIVNNTFEQIDLSKSSGSNAAQILYMSPPKNSKIVPSLHFEGNTVKGTLMPRSPYFDMNSLSYALFQFPKMDAQISDNVFLNNSAPYNSSALLSVPPFAFASGQPSNMSGNTISPPVSCFAGYGAVPPDHLFCAICLPGQSSTNSLCVDCPAGSYSDTKGASRCISCASGYFSKSSGQTKCSACAPGTYTASPGATQCYPCPAGTFQSDNAGTYCDNCPNGKCSPSGASKCTTC